MAWSAATALRSPAYAAGCRRLRFWPKARLGVGPQSRLQQRRSSPEVKGGLDGLNSSHNPSVTRLCG